MSEVVDLRSRIKDLEAEIEEAKRYLVSECFEPKQKPLDDLIGVCTQVDHNFAYYKNRSRKLEKQLPESMVHCTIQFKECDKGHGWLTATNWIDHGCPTCRIDTLKEAIDEAIIGIEWWCSTHPESSSGADFERLEEWRGLIEK